MIFTRCAVTAAKPLWSSVTLRCSPLRPIINSLNRTVATSQQHLGPPRKPRGAPDDVRHLEPFIGTWHEVSNVNLLPFLAKAGDIKDVIYNLDKPNTWISYSKEGDGWTCSTGTMDSNVVHKFPFKLREEFRGEIVPGTTVKIYIYHEYSAMKEIMEYENEQKTSLHILRDVKNENMMTTFSMNDETMSKVYKKKK